MEENENGSKEVLKKRHPRRRTLRRRFRQRKSRCPSGKIGWRKKPVEIQKKVSRPTNGKKEGRHRRSGDQSLSIEARDNKLHKRRSKKKREKKGSQTDSGKVYHAEKRSRPIAEAEQDGSRSGHLISRRQ